MYEYESAPLARILELGKIADFDKVTSNCSYFMLFKNNPLPKVPTSTIALIQENHQSKEKMSEILYNISFPFPVITQSISEISHDIDKMSENNKIYSSIFLFYSFFAWFINYTKTGLVYPGDIVLTSLLSINIESSPNYEVLAKSSFYFGYKTIVESKTVPLFDKYIPTAKSYFIHNDENPKKSYPNLIPIESGKLFVDIFSHFDDPDQTAEKQISFSSDLFEIIDIISESSALHPYIFNEKIIGDIFDFLKSYMCSKTEINTCKAIIKCFSCLLKLSTNDFNFLISNDLSQIILCIINQKLQKISQNNINENEDTNFDFSDHLIKLPSNLEIIQDFTYPKTQTFSNGFDLKPLKSIIIENDQHKIYNDLYDDFNPLIQSLFNHENNIRAFIVSIMALFDSQIDKNEVNHLGFLLLFIISIIDQKKKDNVKNANKYIELSRLILNSLFKKVDLFFDPSVTIFSKKGEDDSILSEEVNSIRNEFLCVISKRKKKLHSFLNSFRLYPLIFTEITYRLTSLNIRIPLTFLNEIFIFYRFMDISSIETKVVEIARESLFNYLSVVYFDSMFDEISIQTSYFMCLMEDNISDEMIKILLNYFSNVGTIVDTKSFALFLKFLQLNSINAQEKVIKVMIRFVKLLISIFQIKISFSRIFKSVYLSIFYILSQIKMTEELLKLVLSLFTLISPEYELSDIDAFYFKKSIFNMYSSYKEMNDCDSLFTDVLKLISVDNSHIYNYRVLQIAYLLFSPIKFNEFICDFLCTNLLKSSANAIENCKKCQIAGFDCFLLDELSVLKKEKYSKENEEKIQKILSIFEIISKYFSSPKAVLKFTSLLTPNNQLINNQNTKVLSKYMPIFMKTLSQLVEVDYWKKTKHMKLDEKDEYCGDFIVPKSFSICFWISCRSFDSEGNLNIFTAESFEQNQPKIENENSQGDENNQPIKDIIKIYMNNNELNIDINQIHSSCPIKKDEWTFVTVSFTKKSVSVYVNLVILSIVLTSKFTNSHFINSNVNDYVSFHGKIGDSSTVSSKEAIELGFFGVLNYQNVDEMKRLYHNGVFSYPINPIFSYNISNHPKDSDTKTLTDSSLISSKAISVTSIVFNFVFCLSNLWKCDILIPLYSLLNIPFEKVENEENVYYDELLYITTHIITKCLVFNPKLQVHFLQTNKIHIITYLLHHMSTSLAPKIILDYRLYQYFYKMYLCVSNEEFHSQIYFALLANLKLINETSSSDHLKILESLLCDINQIPHFVQICSFSVLLSMMNIFYRYQTIDQEKVDFYTKRLKEQNSNYEDDLNQFNAYIDVIKKEVNDHNEQVSSRRKIFHHILLFSADQSFDLSDYYEIVNQCVDLFKKEMKRRSISYENKTNEEIRESSFITHNYIKEILDMIRFLDLFIRQSPLTFKNIKITLEDSLMLNELAMNDKLINEKIIVNLLDTITQFYKQRVFRDEINRDISVHYDLVINFLSQSNLSSSFFKSLIRHAHKSSPELYLICCWYLATKTPNDEELQELFISSLHNSFSSITKQALSDPLFLFWSCVLSSRLVTSKMQKVFFAFLISNLAENWHLMLPAITLYCESPDAAIMEYLHLTSIILFNMYNDINYSSKSVQNISLKSARMVRSVSYMPQNRRSTLNTFFLSSSDLLSDVDDSKDKNSNNKESEKTENNNNNNNKPTFDDSIKCFQNKNLNEKDLIVFLKFSILFILMRPKAEKITTLEKLFVQSPFMGETHEIVQSESDSSIQMFLSMSNKETNNNNSQLKESKNSINYGLRFDDDMNWLDIELAKTIFKMRMNLLLHSSSVKEVPLTNLNEVKLFTILIYYISHSDPQFLSSIKEIINQRQTNRFKANIPTSDPNSASLIKCIFISFDIKKISNDFFSDMYEGAITFLNEIRSNFVQLQGIVNSNFSELAKKVEDLAILQKNTLKDTFHSERNMSENGIKKIKRFTALIDNYDKMQWELLMSSLTAEKGPWYDDSISSFSSSFYFKRSSMLCSSLCPFLMKKEFNVKRPRYKKNYYHDYFKNSDFFFWSHNQLLPEFEQVSFLKSNLSAIENQNTENSVIYSCIHQKIDKFNTVKLKIDANQISIIKEKVKDDEIILAPKTIFIDKNDILILISKIISGEPDKIEIFTISCTKSYLLLCENANAIIDSFISICNPQSKYPLIIRSNSLSPIPLASSSSLNSTSSSSLLLSSQDSFLTSLQKKWIDGKISNFNYIMILNIIACRSFNDIGQYPIFPWVLKDYSCDELDINDESIFRDISKIKSQNISDNGILSPLTVSSYLKRISPFKEITQKCESLDSDTKNEFVFNSIIEASTNASQEITPEFFFMPEFLEKGEMKDVVLPKWCKTPMEFIYLHRKAFESVFVSKNLNDWIDLIFGFRQNEISGQIRKEKEGNMKPGEEFVAFANDSNGSLSLMMKKEELPCQIFTSPHPKRVISLNASNNMNENVNNPSQAMHHYLIKSQDELESVLYVYFEGDNLYVFESSSNVSKFSFKFETFELNFVEKKPILTSGSSKEANNDVSFYPEFGFYQKYSSSASQPSKKSIVAHNSFELNSFYLICVDSAFNISAKKYSMSPSSSSNNESSNNNDQTQQEKQIKLSKKSSLQSMMNDKDMALIKIECADGKFIVVSNSSELHLSIIEIIDDNSKSNKSNKNNSNEREKEKESENENDFDSVNYIIKRYEQFIAIPKCCSISSIFKTFVVATDDGSMQIASYNGHLASSKQWNLSKIVEFNQDENDENVFVPQKILITESFGFIVVYGKMKMSEDMNESFIYVFTINGIFVRKQKIDGEIVHLIKWKSKKGFDFLTLVIKKRNDNGDETSNGGPSSTNNHNDDDDDENDDNDSGPLNAKSYGFSYKIAICEAYYLKLDILKYRFIEKIVSVEFLVEKNLLAVFQSDGNFILINYDPNDLYIE